MRTDIHEIKFEDMSRELRALIAYEPNGAYNVESPQATIDAVRRTTPVVKWEMGVGFFGMEDITEAARHPDLVSSHPDTGEIFGMGTPQPLIPLNLHGDIHKHYRKLLDPLFTPPKMAALQPQIRALANDLIDGFIDQGHAELHDDYAVPLPSTVFLTLFGMPLSDMEFLNRKKNEILKNEGTTLEESEVLGRAAGAELDAHLAQRLAERRAESERRDDLLDSFMHFQVDGHGLDDPEILNLMHMFTIAGLDTVTSSLSCILAWLAKHPDERRHLVANPDDLPRAIEEIMRYENPVPSGGGRWAVRDTEVNGIPLKRGEMVYLCWASANLDPAAFESPLQTDIARDPNRHIAFAAGLHRCLGSHLARAELRTAVDALHQRIPEYTVAEGEQVEYEFAGVRQAKYLPISFPAGGR
ncbi:MAG: cytochrome P450 [Acidimicrobiia bacterium]